MATDSLVGWDLLTQSGNMAKDCDAMASNLLLNDARPVCDETLQLKITIPNYQL